MPRQSETPVAGSYAEYIVSISSAFSDLLPLAQLMTGGHNQKWTKSEKVDVIVVDISRRNPCFELHRIEDLRCLEESCLADIGPDVALRLFLVEDMTAVVVESLGSAFSLPPRLFNCHMKHMGHVMCGNVGSPFPETQQPLSRFRDPDFFSLPFQRLFEEPEVMESEPRQRFTMYRDHNANTSILEERVSGMVCNHHSSSSRIGIFLFDGSIDSATGRRLTSEFQLNFQQSPKFLTDEASSPLARPLMCNMRDVFLNSFSKDFVLNVLADESTILWTILQAARSEWLEIISMTEILIALEMRCFIDISNEDIIRQLKEETSFQESKQLLKESLQVIQAQRGWKLPESSSRSPSHRRVDLEFDFEDLIRRFEAVSLRSSHRMTMFAALAGIQESQGAIAQSKTVGILTGLATFYIPLSFVTSLFGMNLSPIVGNGAPSIWVFFAVAIPLTVLSLYRVLRWELVSLYWSYFMRTTPYSQRRQRWKMLMTKGKLPPYLPSSR